MSFGEELVRAFQKAGCANVDNLDGENLDWYFEQPELETFLLKFISTLDSGQIKYISDDTSTTNWRNSSEGILKYEDNAMIEEQNVKQNQWEKSLNMFATQSNQEFTTRKHNLEPVERCFGNCLRRLAASSDYLKNALVEQRRAMEGFRNNLSSGSKVSSIHTQSKEKYLQEERYFLCQLNNSTNKIRTDENPNPEVAALLNQWRIEQTRFKKCSLMNLQSYNLGKGLESSLENQLKYLKNIQDKQKQSDIALEIRKAKSTLQALNIQLSEFMDNFLSSAEELAAREISPVLLVNYTTKFQRLEQFTKEQVKVLSLLRKQQCRLNLFALIYKLETQRLDQLSESCQSATRVIETHQKLPQKTIDTLENMLKAQETRKKVIESVPIGDFVMETIADILDSDQEELIKTFKSISSAAKTLSSKVNGDHILLKRNNQQIHDKLYSLERTVECLSSLQSPLTLDTNYHGNVQLLGVISKLQSKVDSLEDTIQKTLIDFSEQQEILRDCPREVFQRNLKIKEVLGVINQ